MARWTSALLLAMLGLALASPAEAQWKWRDQRGQTQYSDLPPPPGVPEHDILSRPTAARARTAALAASAPPSGAAAAASTALAAKTTDPELEARRKKAEAEQAAKAKAEEARVAAARADNCRRAQSHMRTLDSGIRIARTNEKGEREILDDQQRAEEARRTREVIAADCR
jgi:hypothetical protein